MFKKSSKALQQSRRLTSVFARGFLVLVTPYYQSVKLWEGSGRSRGKVPSFLVRLKYFGQTKSEGYLATGATSRPPELVR